MLAAQFSSGLLHFELLLTAQVRPIYHIIQHEHGHIMSKHMLI
jgi:hypothetical protein